jgi:hypothetical protein
MGRGRAKAKQTKVARELKYSSGDMDLNRLRADLIHEDDEVDPELLAKYADIAESSTDDRDGGDDHDSDRYASGS